MKRERGRQLRERGLRLVVGGGWHPDFPRLKPNDLSFNIAPRARPDVQGEIARAPFADAVFTAVYFEFVPYSAFTGQNTGAIVESARVLKPGGRLVIHTGSGVNVTEVRTAMRAAGFRYIRVTKKGYVRITARLVD